MNILEDHVVNALFKFGRRQEIFEVGGVKVGGQPGELPTVLVGSIFHEGHKIVIDRSLGIFDRSEAENLINIQEEMSDKTGIPCMLDVVGENPQAIIKYIEFVADVTDSPFLINGPNASTRIKAANYVKDAGLQDRAVYNSINYTLSDEEITAIRETELKTAIIQAFNPKNPYPNGMIQILEGVPGKEGLIARALKAGIEKPLLFMPVLDVPSIGFAVHGVYLAKEKFGLPAGTAPIGVVGKWSKSRGLGKDAKIACRGGALALTQLRGANFIIYGSIAKAKYVFPACAMIDAIIAYYARSLGIRPLTKNHPLDKMFRF
ncbi:MAG: tetrahydromethanopterin S-methyltransferase subunit H [Candidatus Bathyarchaeia archaeon]